ncbi:MAG: SLAP domain-containing protein [Shouchella clausii]|jgi:SLAP domain-containing protein
MQTLKFEEAWQRTISEKDVQAIKNVFAAQQGELQPFLPLWQALNHRGDLLVTVLVQHTGDGEWPNDEREYVYLEDGEEVAADHFSLKRLGLKPHVSMPWTFIFPKETQKKAPRLKGAALCLRTW